ncbi:hypothetical protein EDC01DRAFT_788346 [Geopyxis carbonaria]|nr:hypothetical protein EDC01DRAFT_788346 [Geopyxis carbonaria]
MSQPPPNYQSILLSEVYTIHAGPSHVPFTAHRELLCHHSPTIRTLVSSDSWTQSKSTTIWWEQWDPDTVSRFLEFLYTGQYTGPDLEVVPRDEEQDVLPLESDEQLEEESDEQPEEESAVSVSAEVTDTLSEKHERPITPITRFIQVVKPAELPVLNKEWAVALLETPGPGTINHLEQWSLAHAKIYAIALYTQVVPLAELALCHFVQGLSESTPRPLTNLVRYVYKHTDEKMRGILARWCVLEQKAFFGSGEIED